jgi:hypothetical protein
MTRSLSTMISRRPGRSSMSSVFQRVRNDMLRRQRRSSRS